MTGVDNSNAMEKTSNAWKPTDAVPVAAADCAFSNFSHGVTFFM